MHKLSSEAIRNRRNLLKDERRIEKDLLLAEVKKRWKEEDDLLIQECLETTGHQFEPTPDRHRNLAGTLLRICKYCGTSIFKN